MFDEYFISNQLLLTNYICAYKFTIIRSNRSVKVIKKCNNCVYNHNPATLSFITKLHVRCTKHSL